MSLVRDGLSMNLAGSSRDERFCERVEAEVELAIHSLLSGRHRSIGFKRRGWRGMVEEFGDSIRTFEIGTIILAVCHSLKGGEHTHWVSRGSGKEPETFRHLTGRESWGWTW